MRTEEEIIRYYTKVQPIDVFGIWGTELLMRLPFKKARPFLAKDHGWDEETWNRTSRKFKLDKESLIAEMEDFIQFGTEHAVMHHGIGAAKSIIHYLVWLWLLNDMVLFSYLIDQKNYPNFGSPMLYAVMQEYGMLDLLPENEMDKAAFLNMAKGRPCNLLCTKGCKMGTPNQIGPSLILPKTSTPSAAG